MRPSAALSIGTVSWMSWCHRRLHGTDLFMSQTSLCFSMSVGWMRLNLPPYFIDFCTTFLLYITWSSPSISRDTLPLYLVIPTLYIIWSTPSISSDPLPLYLVISSLYISWSPPYNYIIWSTPSISSDPLPLYIWWSPPSISRDPHPIYHIIHSLYI